MPNRLYTRFSLSRRTAARSPSPCRRLLVLVALVSLAAAPLAAQTGTATVYYASRSAGMSDGYLNATVDVQYALLVCPGGDITIAAMRVRNSVKASDTYIFDGDPVPATLPPPEAPTVRFAGNVLHGGRVIDGFDMRAGDALGLGCFSGDTQFIGRIVDQLGPNPSDAAVQGFLRSLSVSVDADPSPLLNQALASQVRREREQARRAAEAAERERQAEERRRAEEQRLAEERRLADEERRAEEQRRAEEERRAEGERRAEEGRLAEDHEAEAERERERRQAEERRLTEERDARVEREREQRHAEERGPAEEREAPAERDPSDGASLVAAASSLSAIVNSNGLRHVPPGINSELTWAQAGCNVTYTWTTGGRSPSTGRDYRIVRTMPIKFEDIREIDVSPDGTVYIHNRTVVEPGGYAVLLTLRPDAQRLSRTEHYDDESRTGDHKRSFDEATFSFWDRAEADRAGALLREIAGYCR